MSYFPAEGPPFSSSSVSSWSKAHWQDEYRQNNLLPGQVIPRSQYALVHDFLLRELLVPKLNQIHRHLWLAGWPDNIHPLHWDLMVGRQIVVTEDPDIHLICTDFAVFLKPLPICLLDYEVWCSHISNHSSISAAARGLLRSYAKLIAHESDLLLAQQHHLLPKEMKWVEWASLALQLSEISLSTVNKRYQYGELRLSRLNLIYRCTRGRLTYFRMHRSYTSYFAGQYKSSLIMFAYTTVVHAAFQTMLSSGNSSFGVETLSSVSLWFGTATLASVFLSIVFQLVYMVIVFLYNLQGTLKKSRTVKSD